MSNAKHTPGPWTCFLGWDTASHYNVYDGNENTLTENESEREANARLIAAAPDMLKALELIIANNAVGKYAEAFDIARAARERAEGGYR